MPTAKEYENFTLGAKQAFGFGRKTSKLGLKIGIYNMLRLATNPSTSALFTHEAAEALRDDIINEGRILRAKNDADSVTGQDINPVLRAVLFSVPGVASPAIVPPHIPRSKPNAVVPPVAAAAAAAPAAARMPPRARENDHQPVRNVRQRLVIDAAVINQLIQTQRELAQGQQEQSTRIEQVNRRAQESVTVSQRAAAREIATLNGRLNRIENGAGGDE